MINARYADAENMVVAWETPTGFHASSLSTARDVLDYLAAGGRIEPYAPPIIDPKAQAKAELAATDKDLARVAEDLIDALKTKGVISDCDLPQSVRDKLAHRKELRQHI